MEFAAVYDKSDQKRQTLQLVDQYSSGHKDSVSEDTLKELSVRRATTNGFWFSLWILIKVITCAPRFNSDASPPFFASNSCLDKDERCKVWSVEYRCDRSRLRRLRRSLSPLQKGLCVRHAKIPPTGGVWGGSQSTSGGTFCERICSTTSMAKKK